MTTERIVSLVRLTIAAALVSVSAARAGDVAIEFARFSAQGTDTWHVSVTLRHDDDGWTHYADAWRIVTADGRELATRTLYHPHEREQPFTRGLAGVHIPGETARVFVEAHDKRHGWSPHRLEVDLRKNSGQRYEIHH